MLLMLFSVPDCYSFSSLIVLDGEQNKKIRQEERAQYVLFALASPGDWCHLGHVSSDGKGGQRPHQECGPGPELPSSLRGLRPFSSVQLALEKSQWIQRL